MKKFLCSVITLLSLGTNAQDISASLESSKGPRNRFTSSVHDNIPNPPNVKRIALPGVVLEYAEQGNEKGTPVIFLHGLSDSWHSFENVLKLLPDNIHAFALSLRGHGNSEKPATGYLPANFVADIAAFVKVKKLGKVIIAGHSMGGLVAQQFALEYPSLTDAVVLINTDAAFNLNPGLPEFMQQVKELSGPITREFMTAFQQGTLANPIDSAFFNLIVEEGMKVPLHVFKEALTAILHTDIRNDLYAIRQPVLIFWGNKDAICNKNGQDVLAKNIRLSSLVIFEGTGHALHWEEPEKFVKDLLAFMLRVEQNTNLLNNR